VKRDADEFCVPVDNADFGFMEGPCAKGEEGESKQGAYARHCWREYNLPAKRALSSSTSTMSTALKWPLDGSGSRGIPLIRLST
jgi:hypothetical protein